MRLDYAFFAIGAEVSREGRLHVFGGEIGGLAVPNFPSPPMSLTLVTKLLASPTEVGKRNSVSLVYRRPGENGSHGPRHPVEVTAPTNRLDPAADAGVILLLTIEIVFERGGVHEFDVEINGETARSIPFYVSQAEVGLAGLTANTQAEAARK